MLDKLDKFQENISKSFGIIAYIASAILILSVLIKVAYNYIIN